MLSKAMQARLRNKCSQWHEARHVADNPAVPTPQLLARFFSLHDRLTGEWNLPDALDRKGLLEHDRCRVWLRARGIKDIDTIFQLAGRREALEIAYGIARPESQPSLWDDAADTAGDS